MIFLMRTYKRGFRGIFLLELEDFNRGLFEGLLKDFKYELFRSIFKDK